MLSVGALTATALLSSCATLIDGPRQHMTFDSTPPGAVVHVDGYADVTTPNSLELAREKTHRVTIHKDGYRDATLVLDRQFNGMALGNVLLFPIGILGLAIDSNSGATGQLTPAAVSVTLEAGAGEPTAVGIQAVPVEKTRPSAATFLPPTAAGPELRQSAAAAAAAFGELDRYERVELPIAIYERQLEETEGRIATLAFGTDEPSLGVHAAVTAILEYHHTARDIRRTKIASLDKLKRDARAVSSPLPYLSDSEVPRWVVHYPFLRESLGASPVLGNSGEAAGSWYPDRATELLWEHARADTRELATWAAAMVK